MATKKAKKRPKSGEPALIRMNPQWPYYFAGRVAYRITSMGATWGPAQYQKIAEACGLVDLSEHCKLAEPKSK